MTVWCEFEVWPSYDPLDDNSDVIVTLEDGSRWAALYDLSKHKNPRGEKSPDRGVPVWAVFGYSTLDFSRGTIPSLD